MTQLEPTRRSVIKAGAWSAAPAIVVASAAPALAASTSRALVIEGNDDTLYVSSENWNYFLHNIYNFGPGATGDLRVTFVITVDDQTRWDNPTAQARGWTLLTITGTGATRTFSFRYNTQVPEDDSTNFELLITNANLVSGTRTATLTDGSSSATWGPRAFTLQYVRPGSTAAKRILG